ncbi:MAG: LamG domain-containing protein [Kiritimatiellae bacterium]|nr:LamG domain-containing protein [Kiritimatiellia bacterium]
MITACLCATLLAVTAGWENICAERTEFPATPAIWKADFTQKTNFVWELREGAQGTVVFESDGVRIKKTNTDGYIVVKAQPFSVEKGDGVRFSADHETLSADVDYSSGVLRYHGRKERLNLDKAERKNFWNGGLQTMRGMPCTAPGMTYRKYGQCFCEDDLLTPVIVVSGAPSESVWRNWFAEDLQEADDAWNEWRNNIPFAERAGDRIPAAELETRLAADRDHTAEIRRVDGVSRLLLDGEIVPASVYKGMHYEFEVGRDKGETFSGKPLDGSAVKLMVKAVRPGYHCDPDGGNVDIKFLAAQIKSAMRLAPNSLFLVAVSGQAPADFVKKTCPQEAWIDEKGLPVMGLGGSCMVGYLGSTKEQFDKGACMWPSPSSPTWRKWVNASIRALVAELKAQKLDKRVVGIHIYGYHDGQYSVPYTDHSPCAQAEYRQMIAEPGCISTNYAFCCKQMAFRAQEEFVRTFKQAMGKPTIGVMWCESPLQGAKNASLDITSFVNSDAMDAVVCQPNYRERLPGFPTVSALPLDSLHLHGKMFWNEYDYRTYAPVKTGHTAPSLKSLGTSADFPMWQSVYRKVAGEAAATRMGYWFYDMSGGWYHTPAMTADIRHNVAEEAALARLKPSTWQPDLAVVVDEEQILQEGDNPLLRITHADEYIYASSCRLWGTSGVPYARYLAEDTLRNPEILAGKKMVILAFFRKIDARRAALLERLAKQGTTLVFLSETGVRGGAAITGFEPELRAGHFDHRIVPSAGVTENVASLFYTYCQREVTHVIPLGARCTVKEQPGMTVLARYADGNEVALAERKDADCRRIYVAEAGGLTPALINRFAREAGCYAPVDGTGLQVDMNGDFVSVHCLRPGTYSFRLPFACRVMNLKTYAYEPVVSGALTLTLTAGETCRFRLLADEAAAQAWEKEVDELKKTATYPGESVADLYAAVLTTEPPPDAMLLGTFTWHAPGRERRVDLRHNDSFPVIGTKKMSFHEGGTIHARVFFAESSTPPGKPQVYDGICMKPDEFLLGRTQDELYFNLHLDGKWAVFSARPKVPIGRWVDVAVTVAKDEKGYDIRYYIDGEEVKKARIKAGARLPKSLRRNLIVGTCWGTQWRFGGKMKSLDIFERPLLPQEIKALAADCVPTKLMADYVSRFNADDEELYTNAVSNAQVADWMAANVPRFECPDKEIERTYYFRWWTYRKHIRQIPAGWVVTEFLPKVSWSGPHNTIVCPAGHHFMEGRWLRNPEYLDSYARFWFSDEGETKRYGYSTWLAYAIDAMCRVHGDDTLTTELLDGFVRHFRRWETQPDMRNAWPQPGKVLMGGDGKGMFLSTDNCEGSEFSLSGHGYRPLFNSAMYAEAKTIAAVARRLGRSELAAEFDAKAAVLENGIKSKIWNVERGFFTAHATNGRHSPVRELHGYAPWYFALPLDAGYDCAWQWLDRDDGFNAPRGLTFPEQSAPGFKFTYEGHECQWNGPSWPFATSIALTALRNRLQAAQPEELAAPRQSFGRLLHQYAAQQVRIREDGRTVPWIDEDYHPFTGDWISRTVILQTPKMKARFPKERGKDYNHSTFCDLVIGGLCGLVPQADGRVVVRPLAPSSWDWWCVENVRYHGHDLTILFDRDGTRYNRGKGLVILQDGKRL